MGASEQEKQKPIPEPPKPKDKTPTTIGVVNTPRPHNEYDDSKWDLNEEDFVKGLF